MFILSTDDKYGWIAAVVLIAVSGFGCTEQAVMQVVEDCTTPGAFDIAGVFEERFKCAENGMCVDPDVTSYILIRPDAADTDASNGTDYTFCDTPETGVLCHQEESGELSWSGSGTLCGNVFAWTATAPGSYNEAGFWRFADNGDTFVKTSQYMYISGGGGGECTGTASRIGSPPDPAPIGDCPQEVEIEEAELQR